MIGGYFTREHGPIARACSTTVAVVIAFETLTAVLSFDVIRTALSAAAAWGFAANLQASIGRKQRILAMAAQIMSLLAALALLVLLMMLADGGRRGWEELVSSWLGIVIAIGLTILAVAIVDGIEAYREEA